MNAEVEVGNKHIRVLHGIWKLIGATMQERMRHMYEIGGQFNYDGGYPDKKTGEYHNSYGEATHYIVGRKATPAQLADPKTPLVMTVRMDKRYKGQTYVEDWLITRKDGVETVWDFITDHTHSKKDSYDLWRQPKHSYSHLRKGDHVHFVCQKPMPEGFKYQIVEWRGSAYENYNDV